MSEWVGNGKNANPGNKYLRFQSRLNRCEKNKTLAKKRKKQALNESVSATQLKVPAAMSLHEHVLGFEVIITPLHHVTSHQYIQVCICQNKRQHTCPIDLGYSFTTSSYCDSPRLWYYEALILCLYLWLWDCDSMILWYYCWWKKSCTTWDVRNFVKWATYQLVQDFFHQQ